MSDDVTDDTDLFDDSESSEETTDTETSTEDQESESKAEKSDDVKLEEPKKPTAEEQRQKQVDVWTQRVANGEVGIDDLPPNLKWLKKSIEKNLEAMDKQPEIADLVAKEVAKAEDDREFKALKSSLKNITLTKEQRTQLQEEYNELASVLPKSKALAKALKIVGAKEEEINVERKKAAQLPKASSTAAEGDEIEVTLDNFHDIPSDKRVEFYEKHRQKVNKSNMNK